MAGTLQRAELAKLWLLVRSSLWFLPALIILAMTALALGLVSIDFAYRPNIRRAWSPLLATDPAGARAILATIATAMATISGVVFSITIVALALASSPYTSRVLRTFMRDRATQTVLDVFVGVHLYCLLVLLTIDERIGFLFVPSISVLGAVLLAVIAIGFFIFFIHHISSSIQVVEICRTVALETLQAIEHLFPAAPGDVKDSPAPAPPGGSWACVPARQPGYIQKIDADGLMNFAHAHQAQLRMACTTGDFVIPEQTL